MSTTEQMLTDEIKELLENEGFEFIELKFVLRGKSSIIRVFADSDSGITIKECQDLSVLISDHIYTHDKIEGEYILEVSSPGINRALKSDRDFQKNKGREVVIDYKDGLEEKQITGKIIDVTENVSLEIRNKSIDIPLCEIIQGTIKLKW